MQSVNYNSIAVAVGCTVLWSPAQSGMTSVGATQYIQYSTLAACQQYCASVLACVAVNFDASATTSAGCWVHTNSSDLQTLYKSPSVTQYVVITRQCE